MATPVKKLFDPFEHILSHAEFVQAAQGWYDCPSCQGGAGATCARCNGTGTYTRKIGTRTYNRPCTYCQGGTVQCPTCGGRHNGRIVGIDPAVKAKMLKLELLALKAAEEPAAQAAPKKAAKPKNWAEIVEAGDTEPAPSFSLLTITEFDPRKCHFRNGQWVEP